MKNIITGLYNLTAMAKIISVKNVVKKRISILNSFKSYTDNKILLFKNNSKKICNDIISRLKLRLQNGNKDKNNSTDIDGNFTRQEIEAFNKKKNNLVDFSYKHFDEREFNSISYLKEKIGVLTSNYIRNKFKLIKKNVKKGEKFIAFKLNKTEIDTTKVNICNITFIYRKLTTLIFSI